MKKLVGLVAAALVSLPLFTACNSSAPKVTITTEADSLNYAFGAANGFAIRENLLLADTTKNNLKSFVKGFDEGYKAQSTTFEKYLEGVRVGQNLNQQVEEGFLMGDSALVTHPKQIFNAVYDVIDGGKDLMFTQKEAYDYVSKTIDMSRKEGNVFTTADIDSLNIAYGLHNGYQIMQYFLGADPSGDAAKEFIKGMKEAEKATDKNQQLYLHGLQIGYGMFTELNETGIAGQKELPVDFNIMRAGLIDGVYNENALMTSEESYDYFMSKLMTLRAGPGQKFLEENAKKEGVITTASGLQYKIIKEGNGPIPTSTDKVKVHYEGRLIDGTVFDSSIERGEPIVFGVTQVIPGWTEALQLMPVGSEYEVYIPYNLGYGERGAGQSIPPYAALVFQVQLLGIEK